MTSLKLLFRPSRVEGNLLNTPYSMAVFTSYLATFLLADSGFCSIFYTFAPSIRIS